MEVNSARGFLDSFRFFKIAATSEFKERLESLSLLRRNHASCRTLSHLDSSGDIASSFKFIELLLTGQFEHGNNRADRATKRDENRVQMLMELQFERGHQHEDSQHVEEDLELLVPPLSSLND